MPTDMPPLPAADRPPTPKSAVITLTTDNADGSLTMTTWRLPACHGGEHIRQMASAMREAAGPPVRVEMLAADDITRALADGTIPEGLIL